MEVERRNAELLRIDHTYGQFVRGWYRNRRRQRSAEDMWQSVLVSIAERIDAGRWNPREPSHEKCLVFRTCKYQMLVEENRVLSMLNLVEDDDRDPWQDLAEPAPCEPGNGAAWLLFVNEVDKLIPSYRDAVTTVIDAWLACEVSERDVIAANGEALIDRHAKKRGKRYKPQSFRSSYVRGRRIVFDALKAAGVMTGELPRNANLPYDKLIF
jgi:hypothetical protein